jgi:hypothetical protein
MPPEILTLQVRESESAVADTPPVRHSQLIDYHLPCSNRMSEEGLDDLVLQVLLIDRSPAAPCMSYCGQPVKRSTTGATLPREHRPCPPLPSW